MAATSFVLAAVLLLDSHVLSERSEEPVQGLYGALLAVQVTLDQAAYCLDRRPNQRLERQLDELDQRRVRGIGKMEEVWGNVLSDQPSTPTRSTGSCTEKFVEGHLTSASTTLDQFDQNLDQAMKPRKQGLWVGNLHLCRATVTKAEILPSAVVGQDALAIELSPQAARVWESLTSQAVNLRLDISLTGQSIARPNVNERNGTGEMWIIGPSSTTLMQARTAALDICSPHIAVIR